MRTGIGCARGEAVRPAKLSTARSPRVASRAASALASVVPGALVDGPILFEADMGYEIDNFEGIDVHRDSGGDIVLTLVSDDNFSFLQRTLLMQFVLLEP